jgi:hypothetical protein
MSSFNVGFTLNCPSPRAFRSVVGAGICVELEQGQEKLWVKGIEATSPEDALGRAHEVANRVLDQVAVDHGLPLTILESPKTIEIQGDNGRNVTIIQSSDFGTAKDEVEEIRIVRPDGSVEVRRPANEVIEVIPSPYDCTRFFRRALVAERLHDWFEAMREYFRAIEWIVSKWGETTNVEGITKVLCSCFADPMERDELKKLLLDADPHALDETQDILSAVAKCLYVQHRNELDHAKALQSASYKLPFDLKAEEQVKKALPLARFVARELIRKFSSLRHRVPHQRNEAQEAPERNLQGPGAA